MAFITNDKVVYDEEYIRDLIFDMLDAEGKEETLDNITTTKEFLKSSSYLSDIDQECIGSGDQAHGIQL